MSESPFIPGKSVDFIFDPTTSLASTVGSIAMQLVEEAVVEFKRLKLDPNDWAIAIDTTTQDWKFIITATIVRLPANNRHIIYLQKDGSL